MCMFEISSSLVVTLTLTVIEELSVGVFLSITCHLKYDSAVTQDLGGACESALPSDCFKTA